MLKLAHVQPQHQQDKNEIKKIIDGYKRCDIEYKFCER